MKRSVVLKDRTGTVHEADGIPTLRHGNVCINKVRNFDSAAPYQVLRVKEAHLVNVHDNATTVTPTTLDIEDRGPLGKSDRARYAALQRPQEIAEVTQRVFC